MTNKKNSSSFEKYYPIFRTLVGTKRRIQITSINPETKISYIYIGTISGISAKSVGMFYNNTIITIPFNLIQSYIMLDD